MNRLTRKYDDNSGYEVVENHGHDTQITLYHYPYADYEECVDKLGKLEDIEDMLSMDLVTAIDLCNKANEQHYIYVQESWGLYKVNFIDDLDIFIFKHCLYTNNRGIWYSFDLQEYKKTWWLKEDKSE